MRPVNARKLVASLVAVSLLVAACGTTAVPPSGGTAAPPGTASAATPSSPAPPASAVAGTSPAAPPLASPSLGATSAPAATTSAAGVPDFAHVYVIVMENRGYADIVDNPAAPYLNGLLNRYASLTDMFGETHPSEPNYIALFSGSTQGVSSDGVYNLGARNLVDQLAAHGRTWRVFAQNVPGGCYTGYAASGGPDGAGTYARKHEPAISFTDISGDPARCANITGFAHFSPAAADFELIIPNLCNDMHDCSTATGDAFLAAFVPRIVDSAAFADSVLFITWDEGTTNAYGGGRIATAVVSPLVKPGSVDPQLLHHYAILRTIEDAWGLGCLGQACAAPNLARLFRG